MANIILIKRGYATEVNSATLQEGEIALGFNAAKTEVKLFVGTGAGTIEVGGAAIAAALASANSYTDGKISDLINGAPEAYDTLKEISDYLATHEEAYEALTTLVGNKITNPAGGTVGQVLKKTADGVEWANDTDTTYGPATTTTAGLMSATDKAKLDGVEDGAEVNVIEGVKVNGTALTPDAQKAVDIPVPTAVSDLTNDSGFQNASQVAAAIAAATVDGGTFGTYGTPASE